jgi:hypothetical protein
MTSDQKKKLLKAKIAVALHDELGRVPQAGRNRPGVSLSTGAIQGSVRIALQTTGAEEDWLTSNLLTLTHCEHNKRRGDNYRINRQERGVVRQGYG